MLEHLKTKYPVVFSTPTFPIDRGEIVFEHKINLRDNNAEPPKKRLYPLD